ncbi:hypothetical protein SKAU_G00379750 [Synaphobranchus kaupii]|uniref:Secreted protein n=1 Tax=Synaphobranchus kaupii TaxID=118154 RepID=A0A9Q1EDE5_SYNKA|nr:hypothetical protein SKAU_G00379750 [Synaphobranchus kaupii]
MFCYRLSSVLFCGRWSLLAGVFSCGGAGAAWRGPHGDAAVNNLPFYPPEHLRARFPQRVSTTEPQDSASSPELRRPPLARQTTEYARKASLNVSAPLQPARYEGRGYRRPPPKAGGMKREFGSNEGAHATARDQSECRTEPDSARIL